jgi:hypothetical protein
MAEPLPLPPPQPMALERIDEGSSSGLTPVTQSSADAKFAAAVIREVIDVLPPTLPGNYNNNGPNITVNLIKKDTKHVTHKQKNVNSGNTNTATTTTSTTTNGSGGNGKGGADDPMYEEDPMENSLAGKCYHPGCKDRKIHHDYSGEGECSSYVICHRRCKHPLIFHDTCANRYARDHVNEGPEVKRACQNCKNVLTFDPNGAWLLAFFDMYMDWPHWILTWLLPRVMLLGVVTMVLWFQLIYWEMRPTDYLHNPSLVELGENETIMFKSVSWGNGDIMQYNFCLTAYSQTDFLCNMLLLPSCKGYYECSYGILDVLRYWEPGWSFLKLFQVPFPVFGLSAGTLWIGINTSAYGWIFYWMWRGCKWAGKKMTWRYRRPSVRITNTRQVRKRK